LSEDEHYIYMSDEERLDKQKANVVPQTSAAGTPTQPPAEAEEEESENDDPTSNGGSIFLSGSTFIEFATNFFYRIFIQ